MVYPASLQELVDELVKQTLCLSFCIYLRHYPFSYLNYFFKNLINLSSSYRWNNKSACIRKDRNTLVALSLPNVCIYYWVANLNSVSLWLKDRSNKNPAWLNIETIVSKPNSLSALLCVLLPSLANNIQHKIIVIQSLHIVNQFMWCLGIQSLSLHSPVINHLFQLLSNILIGEWLQNLVWQRNTKYWKSFYW